MGRDGLRVRDEGERGARGDGVHPVQGTAVAAGYPHRYEVTAGTEGPDAFLALACLTYGADDPTRIERAAELLAASPELTAASVHVAAAAGDPVALARHLGDGTALASVEGGPHAWEPLLYLCYSRVAPPGSDHLACARLLLAAGADPDAGYLWEGCCAFTALTGILGGGEGGNRQPPHPAGLELARLLLDAGADPNDDQALYNRHFRQEDDHLELLFEHGLGQGDGGVWAERLGTGPDAPRLMLEDQLLFACANGFEDRVGLLLRHGVDPVGRGRSHPALRGKSAIGLAVENGSAGIVELLRAAGAPEPVLDPVDELLAALTRGDRRTVETLLAATPELIETARRRDPARVRLAARHGRPDAVRLLVEHGFDLDARRRTTALHDAAWAGSRAMVELLLSLGADPTVRDTEHDAPPSGWAEHNGHAELADILRAAECAWVPGRTS